MSRKIRERDDFPIVYHNITQSLTFAYFVKVEKYRQKFIVYYSPSRGSSKSVLHGIKFQP